MQNEKVSLLKNFIVEIAVNLSKDILHRNNDIHHTNNCSFHSVFHDTILFSPPPKDVIYPISFLFSIPSFHLPQFYSVIASIFP